MKMTTTIDFDEICTGAEWNETVAQVVKDELRLLLKKTVRAELKSREKLVKEITKRLGKRALDELAVVLKVNAEAK
ncbi:hypothetical protein LCGC14_1863430 [marine sediment metagenome]|uniref:Uncharacterized protein n=1 Tax=marine sediment metagenome TaxID=412755 RepID=A0A0F9GV59_9ZZZZ